MTKRHHSFGWLLRHHPDVHASILTSNGGDRAAAAENWQDLQEQIHEDARNTAVKAERVRCLDLQLDAQERGLSVDELIASIDSGKPGVQLPEFEPLPLRGSAAGLANGLVARALSPSP